MQKRDDKVGKKTGYKKKGKRKKKRAKKNIEIDSQKKKEIWLMRIPGKQKAALFHPASRNLSPECWKSLF